MRRLDEDNQVSCHTMTAFSDFFRHASHEEKERVFLEVARKAAEMQQENCD